MIKKVFTQSRQGHYYINDCPVSYDIYYKELSEQKLNDKLDIIIDLLKDIFK